MLQFVLSKSNKTRRANARSTHSQTWKTQLTLFLSNFLVTLKVGVKVTDANMNT